MCVCVCVCVSVCVCVYFDRSINTYVYTYIIDQQTDKNSF